MRYKLTLCYDGTDYSGWQRQENAVSVQQLIEEKLSVKLRRDISVVGCGRTDAGVHARHYVLHFDVPEAVPDNLLHAVNQMLPQSIALLDIAAVHPDFHARFDASFRSYVYHIQAIKDPFERRYSYFFPMIREAAWDKMQLAAELISRYDHFAPFCKSNSDVRTMQCRLTHAVWHRDDRLERYEFRIGADRFLRGMVRLIVGSCLQIGLGKVAIEDLKDALDKQVLLNKPLSVPPEGLFLTEIRY